MRSRLFAALPLVLVSLQAGAAPPSLGFAGYPGQHPRADAEDGEEAEMVDRFDPAWAGEACEDRAPGPQLEGTDWLLVEIEGRPLSAAERARNPRLRLEPDRLQVLGYAGCNRFFGGYRRSGETGLSFEQIASTRKYCMEAMDLEQAVLGALSKSAGFCIADGRLELRSGSGEPLARFVPERDEANQPK